MPESKTSLGKHGEDLSAEFLASNNYSIIERNFRKRYGELDIIASKDEVLYAIEVKYRQQIDEDFHPINVMNTKKMLRMRKVIETYINAHTQFNAINISFCLITVDEKGKVDFYSDL
ncbi:YraN family protein [Leptospira sp. GIMC2001]|uniref:YraN family protein n=1 Tax=Leptospira sp. GIMC2001 TaxID=1513297 RepID=UPI00234ABF28|nr:YraN family protein [Leptospira sp. GIMC2001]WCL47929.1 YraN family protein [Leptospira sp. GIMC2001]